MKKIVLGMMAALCVGMAQGAGFGIYEASARGNAMGGAVVGDTSDATANYYNPANLAFATNVQIAAGLTMINPYCDVEVDHVSQDRMNSGWFAVPSFYLTIPLPADFSLGWGNYTEFGLGSKYSRNWDLSGDTQQTTLQQVTLNPNLAYKITDWWSVSAGIRGSWIEFKNHKQPNNGDTYYGTTSLGSVSPLLSGYSASYSIADAYHLDSRLCGNDWAMGWNAATTLKPTDKWDIGVVYRSQLRHKIKGNFTLDGKVGGTPIVQVPSQVQMLGKMVGMSIPSTVAGSAQYQSIHEYGKASAKLRLPESITVGTNYKFTDRFRGGASVTYTRWSSVSSINWRLPNGRSYKQDLNWRDTFRVGFGGEYDITDWMCGRLGYTFDEDPTSKHHESTMLPAGDRHIIGMGLGFKIIDNLRLDVSYNFIRMNNEHYFITYSGANGDVTKRMSCRNGVSHLIGATLSYEF